MDLLERGIYCDVYFDGEYQGTVNTVHDYCNLCTGTSTVYYTPRLVRRNRLEVLSPCVKKGEYDLDLEGGLPGRPFADLN